MSHGVSVILDPSVDPLNEVLERTEHVLYAIWTDEFIIFYTAQFSHSYLLAIMYYNWAARKASSFQEQADITLKAALC